MSATSSLPPTPSKSVTARALSVLGAFSAVTPRLTLSQISRATGLPVATVFRLAGELELAGFLQRDEANYYSLGIRLWEMGLLTPVHGRLREIAMPYLLNLQYVTKETVQLAVSDGLDAVYVEKLTSEIGVPIQSRIGSRIPLHATAVGQVLLAYADAALIDQIVDLPLTTYTDSTITTKKALLRELSNVRDRGYAFSSSEYVPGAVAIAAPVFVNGAIEAALGVVNYRDRGDIEECCQALFDACEGFSARLESLNSAALDG
jgi:DNA-binding IclR family transcriptional regulator